MTKRNPKVKTAPSGYQYIDPIDLLLTDKFKAELKEKLRQHLRKTETLNEEA